MPTNSIIAPYLCISTTASVSLRSLKLSSYVLLNDHNCSYIAKQDRHDSKSLIYQRRAFKYSEKRNTLVAFFPNEVPEKEATESQTLSHSSTLRLSRTIDGSFWLASSCKEAPTLNPINLVGALNIFGVVKAEFRIKLAEFPKSATVETISTAKFNEQTAKSAQKSRWRSVCLRRR